MEQIYIKARAKVNLTLAILEKKDDGYHNLDSVFQKINLYDEMWIEKTDNNKISIESNIQDVKLEDNIIYKAFHKLIEEVGNFGGVKVVLKKNIPMQAGLGGGSTDCASFLIAINRLFNLRLDKKKIEKIAKSLGADVIPCLYNGAVLANGIGEKIQKINSDFKYYFVIVRPNFVCSTKEMYNKLDKLNNLENSKSKEVITALQENDFKKLSENLMNNFEKVLQEKSEFIKAKKYLENEGAKALLAGSGSCIFGIFEKKQAAKKAYYNLKNIYDTYICTSYNLRRNIFDE